MPQIDDIVQINITDETEVVTRAGFSTLLVIPGTVHTNFDERVRVFSMADVLDELVDLGFATSSDAYLMAQAARSQSPRLSQIAVGRAEADETPAEVFAAIHAEDPSSWYGVAHTTRTAAEIEALVTAVAAADKFYLPATADAAVAAGTAGNVALVLQAANQRRAAVLYHDPDTEDYADVAWLARGLAADLDAVNGQHTWANKELIGPIPDALTSTQRTAIHAANANTYERRMGANVTRNGTRADGGYIDELVTDDWLIARMTEDLYAAMRSQGRIPMSQEGLDTIETIIRKRLEIAQTNGHIESFTVDDLIYANLSAADRASRTIRAGFSYIRRGAIQRVIVNGRASA